MSIDKTLTKKAYADYDVIKIADGVYKINEFNLSTMFVIVGKERAVTIDCGTGIKDYLGAVKKITDLPVSLIATHAHVDHIGGRGQFDRISLSQADIPIIKDVNVFYRKFYIFIMRCMGFKILKGNEMMINKVEKEPEINVLKEGDIIDLGGKTIEVFETPGHTKGSLTYLLREDKILFTGDVVNPFCLMFLKHAADLETMKESCRKILSIEGYDTIWASHLSDPITTDTVKKGIASIEKAQKRGNCLLPWISFVSKDEFTIVHIANKRNKKAI